MRRYLQFAYGLTTYAMFLVTFLYVAGFMANVPLLPKVMDTDPQPFSWAIVLANVGLLSIFAIQHTIMARPAFKRWFGRVLSPRIERNTFVLLTCLILGSICLFWQGIEGVAWSAPAGAVSIGLSALYWLGIAIVFVATINIDHFALFGLRQAFANLRGDRIPEGRFMTPGLYRFVRHPIMVGFLIALWAVPTMTFGHLLFSVVVSSYIFVAVAVFEEPDLVRHFGATYSDYKRKVGSYIPRFGSA